MTDATPRALAFNALLGVVTFVALTLVLREILPPFDTEGVTIKLEQVMKADATEDPFDTLYLGSSRTFRGFAPANFDARLARAGVASRTFNFGLEGLGTMGQLYALDRLIEAQPSSLRWVFIDPESFIKSRENRRPRARQVIGWHTPHATWLRCRIVWGFDLPLATRIETLSGHALAFAHNVGNVGRASVWTGHVLGTIEPNRHRHVFIGRRGDGWVGSSRKHKAEFRPGREQYAAFLERIATIASASEITGELTPAGLEVFRELIARVEQLGARPVFVIGPAMNQQRQLLSAHAEGHIERLIAFHRPEQWPELYDPNLRWNGSYLNTEGARVFAVKLAEGFLALLEEEDE